MSANGEAIIEVGHLVRKFGDRAVLDDISFNVHRGDTLVIMGGSGCGKSTLLRHMIGSMKPTSGSVKLFGEEVTGMSEREIERVRLRFGMLFQSGALLASLTVGENVALPLLQHTDKSPDQIEEIVKQKLQMVGLTGFEHFYPGQLSGGMQQRVTLARLLAADREVFLMDEPFAALDAMTRQVMQEELIRIHEQSGKTTVFVTHNIDEALILADRIVVMSSRPGRVKASIRNDLPRPRQVDVQLSPRYLELKTQIWGHVEEEVRRQIEATSGPARAE